MAKTQRLLQLGQRIRVLIVAGSVVTRQLIRRALESDSVLDIVGVAASASIALAKIAQLKPDVVALDIEMPEDDGLDTLRRIRRDHTEVRVIMFSALTERGASATLEALALGAADYVTNSPNHSLRQLRGELVPKIKQFFAIPENRESKFSASPAMCLLNRPSLTAASAPAVVVLGISTGGPAALARILPHLPDDFPLPFLIVQHMPPLFTKLLADRLNDTCALSVREAVDGALIEPGVVLIAPGDFHMRVVTKGAEGAGREVRIKLDQTPPENSCRPAVDVLFASVAEVFGCKVLAAVLTGMGRDGRRGAALLKAKGASIIAQDEASSIVWGMPGSVVQDGLADVVLPLDEIYGEIIARASGNKLTSRRPTPIPELDFFTGRTNEAMCPR